MSTKQEQQINFFQQELAPWLFSDEFIQRKNNIKIKFKLNDELGEKFDIIVRDLFLQKVKTKNLYEAVRGILLFSEEKNKAIAKDIIGFLVLPVAIYFEGLPFDDLENLGGNPDSYEVPKNITEIYEQIREIEELKRAELEFAQDLEFYNQTKNILARMSTEQVEDLNDRLLVNYQLKNLSWSDIFLKSNYVSKEYKKINEFFKNFHEQINKKDPIAITAYLLVLAKQGSLDEIFERDDKIKEIFSKHLEKKFSKKIANHFAKNLREPVYLSYFLQHILKDILKLDDNESAVLAIKLVNELKRAGDKQYLPIAYGDLQAGSFKWKAIIDKDDRLELAD